MLSGTYFIFWRRRLVIFIFALAVCDSYTEAMGLCQFETLLQTSTTTPENLSKIGGETWIEWNQHLYLPENKTKMTWENADLECKRHHQDAHLVYIESEEENQFVFSSVISVYDDSFWIGLSDEYTEGLWKWGRKTKANYTSWHLWENPEPNGGTRENCAATITTSPTWYDHGCTYKHCFLCERDVD